MKSIALNNVSIAAEGVVTSSDLHSYQPLVLRTYRDRLSSLSAKQTFLL